jgi:hypothetical protein
LIEELENQRTATKRGREKIKFLALALREILIISTIPEESLRTNYTWTSAFLELGNLKMIDHQQGLPYSSEVGQLEVCVKEVGMLQLLMRFH